MTGEGFILSCFRMQFQSQNEIDTIKETFRTELFHGFSKEEEEQLEFLNRKLMENAKNAFKMQQQNSDK